MLARDRAELIMAEHAAGKSIREIAEAHGHRPPPCWRSSPSWASTEPEQRSTGHWNATASRPTPVRTATPQA